MTFFTWDAVKAASNLRKHKVSFDEAEAAFPYGVLDWVDDRNDYGEERRNRACLCFPPVGKPLFITYAPRAPNVVHIISSRLLEPAEIAEAKAEVERRRTEREAAKNPKNRKRKNENHRKKNYGAHRRQG